MRKLLIVLSVAFLGQSTLAHAATDWTPYLKPMLSGCGYLNPTDKLPTRYKSSIASKRVKTDPETYDIIGYEGDTITTYSLKNATAFGQPLLKVEYLQGYEWYHLRLYFKDTKFITLRPQFKLPKIDKQANEYSQVTKNNTSGYEVEDGGYLTLTFDPKQKTITCGGGV